MTRKSDKEKKKAARRAEKLARRAHKGMVEITAQHDCGCCFATMWFKSVESATEAFQKAGLRMGATITDDEGTVHEDIDVFYGFSPDRKEFDRPSLLRLAEKAGLV